MALMNTVENSNNKPFFKDRVRPPYRAKADYTKPLLKITPRQKQDIKGHLELLYGEASAEEWLPEFERVMKVHHAHKSEDLLLWEDNFNPHEHFSEQDLVLITYGDMIKAREKAPLQVLGEICEKSALAINTIHILPFFPYSSDRGFSITNFAEVDPKLGDWGDILRIARHFNLMFDGVMNHISAESRLFQEFLDGDPAVQDLFIHYESPDDLTPDQRSKIFRPRTSDILTRFDTLNGPRYVWTTFSDDQIDFNYRNPDVLLRVLEGLLFYVRNGADIIRLDAVTYIWAEPGTECIHLAQTHEIVKLMRSVMEIVAPGVALLTETNVPHEDNISYFGDGYDEAHMVYNFALPPLVLHTIYSQDATVISKWAATLKVDSQRASFFNILDTHDGIGLLGAKGILSRGQIKKIIETVLKHGGLVSYKSTGPTGEEPYELNTTWWSAINDPDSGETLSLQVKRYLASRAIALSLRGVPGIYLHGILGTDNDHEAVRLSGHNRDINRASLEEDYLVWGFKFPNTKLARVGRSFSRLNVIRTSERAFHVNGGQRVLDLTPKVFALVRTSPEQDQLIFSLINVSDQDVNLIIPLAEHDLPDQPWHNLVADSRLEPNQGVLEVDLAPYDVAWLKAV